MSTSCAKKKQEAIASKVVELDALKGREKPEGARVGRDLGRCLGGGRKEDRSALGKGRVEKNRRWAWLLKAGVLGVRTSPKSYFFYIWQWGMLGTVRVVNKQRRGGWAAPYVGLHRTGRLHKAQTNSSQIAGAVLAV
jgi:hypothetical protein